MSLNSIFKSIFYSSTTNSIASWDFILCILVSLATGFIIALAYTFKNKTSKSFAVTLATLPAVVCMVIMMVNGNLGAGVAVAGAFSLVRFRSAPGTAKEIGAVFLAMGTGLAFGMGYIGFGILFAIIISIVNIAYTLSGFASKSSLLKTLKITIPEDLDYDGIFDDIFKKYTKKYDLVSVRTTNMGSLFKLNYNIILNDTKEEKKLIDELRTRNGNLEISLHLQDDSYTEL